MNDLEVTLARLQRALSVNARRQAQEHGLSAPQASALRAIARLPEATPALVARSAGLVPSTTTGVLDRLEGRELLRRERRPGDRRKVVLVLTETGRELTSSLRELPDAVLERVAGLPAAKRRDLLGLLDQLTADLDA